MRRTEPKEVAAVVVIALALSGYVLTTRAGSLLAGATDLLHNAVGRPISWALLALVVLAGALLVLARVAMTRRTLRRRVVLELLPSEEFDPPVDAVVRLAAGLARTRRSPRGWLDAPASAVRVRLDVDPEGRMTYRLEIPGHARNAVRAALGVFGEHVEVHQLDPSPASSTGDQAVGETAPDATRDDEVRFARAELVLARSTSDPLADIGIEPDPLAGFAQALAEANVPAGERVSVAVDLLPLTATAGRRLRRRLLHQAGRQQAARGGQPRPLQELLEGPGRSGRAAPGELVGRRTVQRALTSKLGTAEPLFRLQILAQAQATYTARAVSLLHGVLAAFDVFSGENHLKVSGLRIPGIAVLGSDRFWRRGRFDRRLASGRFAPAGRLGAVTASEVAGLLKPPTVQCAATNVVRSDGPLPGPPPGLPTFADQTHLLPLGTVLDRDRERPVGVALKDTFFSYMAGRSRYGKTETAIGQFLHLARSGHGCFFLDPHEDAIQKIKGYLTDPGVRERVVEVNLAADQPRERQPGWNLLATQGRTPVQIQGQVDALVDAFASALGWDERNTRALNLTTQSAQALTELSRRLPAALAPTIFQIPTLLGNDDWRSAALPYLSPPTRQFFVDRFPRLPGEAITPITNLIDRLRVAPTVAALLGNPVSSYDIRQAMDQGKIVLACPGSGSVRDRLVANFLVYDLLHAAKTRASLEVDRRRWFWLFLDEVQTYDGAAGGNLAALLEQTAKYGVRALLFNQNPERLTAATLNAVTTNRSHLMSTALNAKAATLLTREWGGAIRPEQLTRLRRYTYLASITVGDRPSPPFLIRGRSVQDLFPDQQHPERVEALEEQIDRHTVRVPVAETVTALGELDQRILEYLQRSTAPPGDAEASRRWQVQPAPEREEQR